jgi:hypothetical protein
VLITTILTLAAAVLFLAAPLAATWGAHRAFEHMVGPQDRYRKLWYFVAILELFMLGWVWRHVDVSLPGVQLASIDTQAAELAVREESRGEADLRGSALCLCLTGSRGAVTCFLWQEAIEAQKKNQWGELDIYVTLLTKLQPHFIRPWLFQSWNLSYNVSVESDRPRDKYFFISRGIELLVDGERQNANHPDLRWSIGFYLQHKIMQSDDTNYLRSLMQLSMIPPNERDPARFWKQTDKGAVFDDGEFEKFVAEHPQLVRRLRDGMRKDTDQEKRRLFYARTPRDVVRFLGDNFTIPSLYQQPNVRTDLPANVRGWQRDSESKLIEDERLRFPPLPPPPGLERGGKQVRPADNPATDPEALTWASGLRDEHDGYAVAHAWYAYAQEPLPRPHRWLPGTSEEITDRSRHRRPRNMTTLIFRNYPAQARRYQAERLQQEGWFDSEPWDTRGSKEWDQLHDPNDARKPLEVGGGREWSQEAWERAKRAWEKHGLENHIHYRPGDPAEATLMQQAREFARQTGAEVGALPPPLDESRLDPKKTGEQLIAESPHVAARVLYEYNFYRGVSNFAYHYNRAVVEAKPETVACRKLFSDADWARVNGRPLDALEIYQKPVSREKIPAWGDRKFTPLEAWRELVLLKNDAFRRDQLNQEGAAELQIRYLQLYNRYPGKELKKKLAAAAGQFALVPYLDGEAVHPPVIEGPLDRRYVRRSEQGEWELSTNGEGEPLILDVSWDVVLDRMHLPGRRRLAPTEAPQPGQGPPRKQ